MWDLITVGTPTALFGKDAETFKNKATMIRQPGVPRLQKKNPRKTRFSWKLQKLRVKMGVMMVTPVGLSNHRSQHPDAVSGQENHHFSTRR
nr:hypothetical protein BaRGS_011250 [Batillaria attramentaria]